MTYSREGKARARACQSDNILSWVKLTQAEKQLVDPNSIRNRHGLVLLCAPWTAFLTFTTSILPPHTSLCFFGDASKEVWRRQLVPHPICLLKGSTWKWFPKLVSHSAHWYVGKTKTLTHRTVSIIFIFLILPLKCVDTDHTLNYRSSAIQFLAQVIVYSHLKYFLLDVHLQFFTFPYFCVTSKYCDQVIQLCNIGEGFNAKEGREKECISDGRANTIKCILLRHLHDAHQCRVSWAENVPPLKAFQYSLKSTQAIRSTE